MCDFIGVTKRPLTIPHDFVPYMEKHRLYEFFYELVTQLIIQQPEDPIVFMKQCVQHIIRKRDIPRVILIAPPNFDKTTFAEILQEKTGIRPVTLEDLHALSPTKVYYIPRNKKEARAIQYIGVIPTHVIQIILPSTEDKIQEKNDTRQCNYRRTLRDLREVYANFLIEVEAGTKTIQDLGKNCAELMKVKRHYGAPSLFRIVLIGPRGSGRRSLAKHISEKFNLVYVDFNYILEQACLRETALSEMLRLCEHRCVQKFKSEAQIQIIEQYVLKSDCLKRGWILIGYPNTVEEFKLLDMISTPPNRVIVLKINTQICGEKIVNHQYDSITGSEHSSTSCESFITDSYCKLDSYSKDYEDIIKQDVLWEYKKNIEAIMQYAGETATIIDAMDEKKCVREKLEACLMRPAPSAKPRIPYPPIIDPMTIEFDPDDEPDPSIFDNIRAPEPTYFFI
ncbi:hypothetical protein P5V15_008166 [Pogonomyrmex californicus]